MSDYLVNVQKYDAKADAAVVAAIVKHLGIALRNRDSSLVSCSDPAELKRVHDGWCTKKLAQTDSAKIDAAIKNVCTAMKADHNKSRVTFYYLCAKEFGLLDTLVKK